MYSNDRSMIYKTSELSPDRSLPYSHINSIPTKPPNISKVSIPN